MKNLYFLLFLIAFSFNIKQTNAQTEWTGPPTTFTKTNNADWTLEANQDRITSNVWITRANNSGLFNIVTETQSNGVANMGTSPADTEWAYGTINDGVGTLTFATFNTTHAATPPDLVNQDLVLHLITDNIYIDITFLSWSSNGTGGGFSYTRSTDQSLGTDEFEEKVNIKLFPNPTSDFITISGLVKRENFNIYNILGKKVLEGKISQNQHINVENLTNGLYFIKFESSSLMKFVKK